MPKRYYCDYCNKSFQDNPRNRSKHMKGFLHLRNKELHYSAHAQEIHLTPDEQRRFFVFQSSASGEELLQQWLQQHPDVVKRFDEMSKSETSTKTESNTKSEDTDGSSQQSSLKQS